MKLLKDYDCIIEYHPGNANVVADALSWKSTGNLYYVRAIRVPLLMELRSLGVDLTLDASGSILATLKVRPLLLERIILAQFIENEVEEL